LFIVRIALNTKTQAVSKLRSLCV